MSRNLRLFLYLDLGLYIKPIFFIMQSEIQPVLFYINYKKHDI